MAGLLGSGPRAAAQVTIRLEGVPDLLSFPLANGANCIVTAHIEGDTAKAVWLAYDALPSASTVPLTKTGANEYAINLASREVAELLKAGGLDGQIRVLAKTEEGLTVHSVAFRYTVRDADELLVFPFDEAKMTIHQRSSKRLPTGDGSVLVQLGDITAGQVLVNILAPHGRLLVDAKSMREGDTVRFSLASHDFVLQLEKLVNLLIGNDYSVFILMTARTWEAKKIEALLQTVEASDATFTRNDTEFSGQEFAAHLRTKGEYSCPKPTSLNEFLERIARRSSVTGEPYRVKLPTGDIVSAEVWLRQQVAKMQGVKVAPADKPVQESVRAPTQSKCRLNEERFDRVIHAVEDSGATFIAGGNPTMTAAAFGRMTRFALALSEQDCGCFDRLMESYITSLEESEDRYEVKLPDGHRLPAARWLRDQVDRAVTEDSPRSGVTLPVAPNGPSESETQRTAGGEGAIRNEPEHVGADRPRRWAAPLHRKGLPNLHRVSEDLYRGAQPTEQGFAELAAMGIKTIVNLRTLHSDRSACARWGLDYVHIRSQAWETEDKDVIEFLRVVMDPQQRPVFVHCDEGADRTGLMCAIYRIIVQGWTKDEAIREMTNGGFGYHAVWRNLTHYIRHLDVARLQRRAGC